VRVDPPRARVFHKEHHFNAPVHVGIVLRDFATGDRNGDVAKDSNLNAKNGLRERAEFGPGEALHAVNKILGALRFDRACGGIEAARAEKWAARKAAQNPLTKFTRRIDENRAVR
jgi:hypothetical protein